MYDDDDVRTLRNHHYPDLQFARHTRLYLLPPTGARDTINQVRMIKFLPQANVSIQVRRLLALRRSRRQTFESSLHPALNRPISRAECEIHSCQADDNRVGWKAPAVQIIVDSH